MGDDADGTAGQAVQPPGWGYVGAHLITLLSREGALMFGQVAGGRMVLNEAGRIVAEEWQQVPGLIRGEFTVMPNHMHGIVWPDGAKGRKDRRGARRRRSSEAALLGAAIARFKAAANRRVNALPGASEKPIWQPGYRNLAIEDAQELAAIRRLIQENPARWAEDVENPDRSPL